MTEREIFTAALNKSDPADRVAYLNEVCAGDPGLRQRVESLLAEHEELGSFLESPSPTSAATIDRALNGGHRERPGTRIGPYKLLQQIGEGGMGTVYMAEQTEPLRRSVAIKVIKAGMDSQQVLARFDAERQALALMDHPNIARVFDAGTTESGRPYFVMELVKGIPITKHCDEKHLSPRERLQLMVPVCQAIQHAHQKGIIHRDIKPSNILIAQYDGQPVAKVIDFGIAKATAQQLTERTLFTELGQLVGTLEYMSPEQAQLNQLDIDTRSDIYSLGVLLYELLTGSTPFDRKSLQSAAFDEMLRIIREDEPPTPSTKLSSSASLHSVAANRHLEPAKLTRLVRGELDWIVMKTLEKDRNRRYDTANALAADVQRYLADEPVQACPPSAAYRFRKFARRNKGPLLAVVVIFLTLFGGIVGTTLGLIEAWRQRDGALTARQDALQAQQQESEQRQLAQENERKAMAAAEAEKKAKKKAEANEAATNAVLDFVENKVFAAARPKNEAGGQGYDVKLEDAVKAALPFVEKSFANQPAIEARLRMTLGISFRYLGHANIAAEQHEIARRIYTKYLGPDDPVTLNCMNSLANSYEDLGRSADALQLNEETLTLTKAKLGPDHPDTLRSMNNLANSCQTLGRHTDALKLREEVLRLQKVKPGPSHPDMLQSMNNLANSYYFLGRHADAIKLHEESLELQKGQLGPDHPDTLRSMNNLAGSYHALGRDAEALQLIAETLALMKATLGPDHPLTLSGMNNLANCYDALGRHADALTLREETLELQKAKIGPDHPDTLRSMNNLASSYDDLGRHADALKLNEETLTLTKAMLGTDHPDTLRSRNNLAHSYGALGRHTDALKLREETLELQKAKLGPDHPDTLTSMNNLANSYHDLSRHADALTLREETLELQKAKLGPDHPDTLRSMNNLANSYRAVGRDADALQLITETLALMKAKLGPDHPNTLSGMNNLANCYDALGRHADALKLYEETLALRKVKLGPNHPNTLSSMWNLAECLVKLERGAEALPIIDEGLKRAADMGVHAESVPSVIVLRLRLFEKSKDAAGCRSTAEMWEKLNRADAGSLYNAACCRAVTAAVIKTDPQTSGPDAIRLTKEEADRAMAWLKQAVAVGYKDAAEMKNDKDLDVLRDHPDFQELISQLAAEGQSNKK